MCSYRRDCKLSPGARTSPEVPKSPGFAGRPLHRGAPLALLSVTPAGHLRTSCLRIAAPAIRRKARPVGMGIFPHRAPPWQLSPAPGILPPVSYTPPAQMEVPDRLASTVTLRLSPAIREALTAAAEARGVSVSQIVREAVHAALEPTPTAPTA